MNKILRNSLENLYKTYKEEDKIKENRLERWRNLEPESALFISIIIRGQQSKHVLELGTSNGFSTIWFADALRTTNGFLTSVEIEEARTLLAQENLNQYQLIEQVELITIDAQVFLTNAKPIYDLIFLDAERKFYIDYWPNLKKLLQKSGTLLIVDNVISHKEEVENFIQIIHTDPDFMSTIINVGAGILLVSHN